MLRQKRSLPPGVLAAKPCAGQSGKWKSRLPRKTPQPSTPDIRTCSAKCSPEVSCALRPSQVPESFCLEERGYAVHRKTRENDQQTEEKAIHAKDLFALAANK